VATFLQQENDLLQHFIFLNLTGDTALHIAVRERQYGLAGRLILLGASVDVVSNNGQTALLLACAANEMSLVRDLLQAGAPPNLAGNLRLPDQTVLAAHARESSLTPLHVAASSKNLDLVKLLVEFGADINICDERGRCPLAFALLNEAAEVAC
jgi:ankyrin repeat protein